MSFFRDEYDLKAYIDNVVEVPQDADQLKEYMKEMARAKRLILDGVWDHIVSHLANKGTSREITVALSTLYQGTSEQWKMFLEENLRCIRMQKGEHIDPFLTRIQKVRDQLAVVGAAPQPSKLVQLALTTSRRIDKSSSKVYWPETRYQDGAEYGPTCSSRS